MSLTNPYLVFILAFFLAIFFPNFAVYFNPLIVPLLILILTLSFKDIEPKLIHSDLSIPLRACFLNYIIPLISIILPAFILIKDIDIFAGLVFFAAVPPAAISVFYSDLYGGDKKYAVSGQIFTYMLSIIVTPLIVFVFLGKFIDITAIFHSLVLLILVPYIFSRFLKLFAINLPFDSTALINFAVAIIIYAALGSNLSSFSFESYVLPVIFVLVLQSFVVATLFYYLKNRFNPKFIINDIIFATFKNGALALALSFSLFSIRSTIPIAFHLLLSVPFILYLSFLFQR